MVEIVHVVKKLFGDKHVIGRDKSTLWRYFSKFQFYSQMSVIPERFGFIF